MSRIERARGGFTLLEVIVALGIFAVGATAAFALLVAAAAAGRRAEHAVNVALVADRILGDLTIAPGTTELPWDPSVEEPDKVLPEGAAEGTVYVRYDQAPPEFPDYRYDVAVTPLLGADDLPSRYLVEVEVRWSEKGSGKSQRFQRIVLPAPSVLDNPEPGQTIDFYRERQRSR